jgi:serine/threonine protein kinase
MATIYRAVSGERAVALKVVKPDIVRNKTAAARFHREAKAASRLRHPGIVQVLAWGFEKEMPYIAMELVEGEDLFEFLDRRGLLSEEQSMRIGVRLCEALAAAHAQGVVHRDLKPENIMVTPRPDSDELSIKVLDFGIAKLVGPGPGDMWGDETVPQVLTKVGSAVGTPSHMAPEQARGDPVDGRTDIYACGVLLYEMSTGHLPFEGDNPLHVAIRQVRDPPPPPSVHRPDILPALERIILRALEKDPGARFQTAIELRSELLVALGEQDDGPDVTAQQLAVADDRSDDAPAPSDDVDDAHTAQRDQPAELRASQERPPAARTLVAEGIPARYDDEHDPPTRVVKPDSATAQRELSGTQVDDPATMELDTVAGPTMRREVGALRQIIDAALQASRAPQAAPRPRASETGTLTSAALRPSQPPRTPVPIAPARTPVPLPSAPPESTDDTPFLDRARIARPLAKTATLTGQAPADAVANVAADFRLRAGGTILTEPEQDEDPTAVSQAIPQTPAAPRHIEDEDSEGSVATVVSSVGGLPSQLEKMVEAARAAAALEREKVSQSGSTAKRSPALSVTKQSEFGMIGLSSRDVVPAIEVIPAAAEPVQPMSSSYPPPQPDPQAMMPHDSSAPPITHWPPPTQGRRAANELEDLLKQMPQQRQPILSSMVVIVLLGLAIVVLVWLLVGAATF